jgi:predicted transposase YbfD/YdcC
MGVSLEQVKTAEKSNEITAIPALLALLEVKGCLITLDAMGCQTDIAKKIIEKQADTVLAVKDNMRQSVIILRSLGWLISPHSANYKCMKTSMPHKVA